MPPGRDCQGEKLIAKGTLTTTATTNKKTISHYFGRLFLIF
jgi:hypothetical protein